MLAPESGEGPGGWCKVPGLPRCPVLEVWLELDMGFLTEGGLPPGLLTCGMGELTGLLLSLIHI